VTVSKHLQKVQSLLSISLVQTERKPTEANSTSENSQDLQQPAQLVPPLPRLPPVSISRCHHFTNILLNYYRHGRRYFLLRSRISSRFYSYLCCCILSMRDQSKRGGNNARRGSCARCPYWTSSKAAPAPAQTSTKTTCPTTQAETYAWAVGTIVLRQGQRQGLCSHVHLQIRSNV